MDIAMLLGIHAPLVARTSDGIPLAMLFGLQAPYELPECRVPVRDRRTTYRSSAELRAELMEALQSGPGSTTELAMHVNTSGESMRKILTRMERQGIVKHKTIVFAGRNTKMWELVEVK